MDLKQIARRTYLYDTVEPLYSTVQKRRWLRVGRPLPAPAAIKRDVIRAVAFSHGLRVLVETGTLYGDTIRVLRHDFDRIYSIELDLALHARAVQRCRHQDNTEIMRGDSTELLPHVLEKLQGPALFWLDAHYSGGETAQAELETPIMSELKSILGSTAHDHVVLIDDLRNFADGAQDYPSISQLVATADLYGFRLDLLAGSDAIAITRDRREG